MSITAAFHFEVPDLWISGSLLGAKIDLPGRISCWLQFPADEPEPFGIPMDAHIPSIGGWRDTAEEPKAQVAVRLIQVTVEINSDVTAAQFAVADRQVGEDLHQLLDEACAIARDYVLRILAWSRVSGGQYWLEPQQVQPRLGWITVVRDASGARIPTGYNDPLVVRVNTVEPGLDLSTIALALSAGPAPVAETLLADAKFYGWHASEPSSEMALMLAAVAVEARIKTFLSETACAKQHELVQLILTNPRDVSVAAASLYDKALKAVTGRSLREDDKNLYKSITRLFEDRNSFAHRGSAGCLDAQTLSTHLRAASQAFLYLTSIAEPEPATTAYEADPH